MNGLVVLASVSVLGIAALFLVLGLFLRSIIRELEEIGGPATRFARPVNYLSKIRLGLRAIERQSETLAPQVTRLNEGLRALLDGLRAVEANLAGLITAVSRPGRS